MDRRSSRKYFGILPVAAPAALLSFTFFVFGPIQLYITNISDFFFSILDILGICLLTCIITLLILIGIGAALRKRTKEWYICLLGGIALALYIQGNFVVTDYGVLNGESIDWSSYRAVAVWNTLLWLACIFAPFLVRKFLPRSWKTVVMAISGGIIAVQIITLATLSITTDFQESARRKNYTLTTNGEFELSDKDNILIFILDAYDSQIFSDFIEQHAEYKESVLKDFTYYPDTVGGGYPTLLALPQILTGQPYAKSEGYADYIDKSYKKTTLYKKLMENNYDIGIYTNKQFVSPGMGNLIMNMSVEGSAINSYPMLGYYLYKFTACSYFPHILKESVWMYSGDFNSVIDISGAEDAEYVINDAKFYEELGDTGISLKSDKNAFRIYHLFGAHAPYMLDENAQRISGGTSLEEQQLGLMTILGSYFYQMKELGIYDEATILILADHGSIKHWQNPLLLLKTGTDEKGFTTSNLPVSYANLQPTLLSLINSSQTGNKNIFELNEADNDLRYIYLQAGAVSVEYIVNGAAYDDQAIYATGNQYSMLGAEEGAGYSLGSEIYFGIMGTGHQYTSYGFSAVEQDFCWTNGYEAELAIPLNKTPTDDLYVEMSFASQRGIQRVGILINGSFIGYYTAEDYSLKFPVPAELVADGELVITMELPDAGAIGADPRILALAFHSIVIDTAMADDELGEDGTLMAYELGNDIVFTAEDNGQRYFTKGISGIEGEVAWSLGKSGQMVLDVGTVESDLVGEFQFGSVYAPPQRLIVRCKDQILYEEEVSSVEEPIRFSIPKDCLERGWLILDLEYPDAVSPESRGLSTDPRVVAFLFYKVRFYPG